MARFISTDGRRWRVGRRWLAWRPRPSRPLRWCREILPRRYPSSDVGLALAGFFTLLVVALLRPRLAAWRKLARWVLLIPVAIVAWVPLSLVHLLNWAAALLVTPFALFGRAALGRPWPVFAYVDGSVSMYKDPAGNVVAYTAATSLDYGDTGEYRGTADGGPAADELVARVGAEISRYGEPKSLTPPDMPMEQPLGLQESPESEVEPEFDPPEWVRRGGRWFQRQLTTPPLSAGRRTAAVGADQRPPDERVGGRGETGRVGEPGETG